MGAEGRILQQDVHDALGGVAVPEWWNAARLAFSGENIMGRGNDFCGIGSKEMVCILRIHQRQRHSIRVPAIRGAETTVRAKKTLVRCKAFDSGLEPA